jgi:hypothetical protein
LLARITGNALVTDEEKHVESTMPANFARCPRCGGQLALSVVPNAGFDQNGEG